MASFLGSMLGGFGEFATKYGGYKLQQQEAEKEANSPLNQMKIKNEALNMAMNEQKLKAANMSLQEEAAKKQEIEAASKNFMSTIFDESGKPRPGFFDDQGNPDFKAISQTPAALKLMQLKKEVPGLYESFIQPAQQQQAGRLETEGKVAQQQALAPGAITEYAQKEKIQTDEAMRRDASLMTQRGELESLKSNLKKEMSAGIENSTFSKTQKDDVYKFINRVDKDKVVSAIDNSLLSAETIRKQINSTGPGGVLSTSVIETQMPRLMREVGNLTQTEQTKWRGSADYATTLNRLVEKAATGKMIPEDIKALNDVLDNLTNSLASGAIERVNTFKEQTAGVGSFNDGDLDFIVNPYIRRYSKYIPTKQTTTGQPGTPGGTVDSQIDAILKRYEK